MWYLGHLLGALTLVIEAPLSNQCLKRLDLSNQVDAVFDAAASETLRQILPVVKDDARVVSIVGDLSDEETRNAKVI